MDIQPLVGLLQIPSISAQDEYLPDMAKCRKYLIQLFKSLGFTTQLLPAQKHPAVFAQKIVSPKLPTVLIYGHYDVQPPDPLDQWASPPFSPTVKNGRIYARGATDNKGQLMIHIMAIKRLLDEAGKTPLNFKFIIEGEEEIGSPSVANIAKKYRHLLQANYIVVSDSEMPSAGQPAIDISLRGLIYTEVRIQTAKQDLHSGQFGGVAPNPAVILAHIISQLKNKDNHVLVPGFYDDVVPLTRSEAADFTRLEPKPEHLLKESAFFFIGGGESQYSLNQRRWSQPTLDVNGIWGGYSGPGSKTIIPASAGAKISMRLVPNQTPDDIFNKFTKFAKSLIPQGVKLEVIHHADCLPYKAPTNHPVFNLAKASLRKSFGKTPVFYATGGSIGFVPILTSVLKIPCLMIGFGLPDDNLHSPNEHLSLDNYQRGITAMVDFYSRLPQERYIATTTG